MKAYGKDTLQLIDYGRQDCSNLHSFGPGMRLCYIIHYVIKGAGYLEYNNQCYPLKAGQAFFTSPYVTMYYYPDPKDPWEYTWVNFVWPDFEKQFKNTGLFLLQPLCPFVDSQYVAAIFDRISKLDIYEKNRLEANGLLLTLIGLYADHAQSEQKLSIAKNDSLCKTAFLLIESNYHSAEFNINALCNMMSIKRITLYRLFLRTINQTPKDFLTNYRLEQACIMLKLGASVKSVAISCGFFDPFYFSKTFRLHYHCSPSEYKKKCYNPP